MRFHLLLIAGAAVGAANAAPVCQPKKAVFGDLGSGRCAPVNGSVPQKRPPDCANGEYAPDGHTRTTADGGAKPHLGVDLEVSVGSEVYASAIGKVVDVRIFPKTLGRQVSIEHEIGGRVTRYAHLSKTLVEVDDPVALGQQIGESGKSGNASETSCPHLHLEVRRNINPSDWTYGPSLDPLKWLAAGDAVKAQP